MARKVVSKLTYHFLTVIFHSLCLSGLIWQITQISVNFFQFDVLTDVRIFTPEENKWKEKVAYICFEENRLIDRVKMDQLGESYSWTFGQRFQTRWKSDQVFPYIRGLERKYAFIVKDNLCFQFQFNHPKPMLSFIGNRIMAGNTIPFWMSIGHESNNYDESREIETRTDWVNKTQKFTVKSNSFKILKMASPYSDHCFNYPDIGLRDRNDAIATCESNQTHVSLYKVVRDTDDKFSNMSRVVPNYGVRQACAKSRSKHDCNQRLFLIRLTTELSLDIGSSIVFEPEADASFSVISKPKIDNIDYVTYILGALGSWIGFSFIGINPIPHFFETEAGVNSAISHNSCHSNIKLIRLERESIKMKQELDRIKQEKSKQEIESLKLEQQKSQQEFLEQSREIAQIKRALVQITHRIRN